MRTELGKRRLEGVLQQLHCPYLLFSKEVMTMRGYWPVIVLLFFVPILGIMILLFENACSPPQALHEDPVLADVEHKKMLELHESKYKLSNREIVNNICEEDRLLAKYYLARASCIEENCDYFAMNGKFDDSKDGCLGDFSVISTLTSCPMPAIRCVIEGRSEEWYFIQGCDYQWYMHEMIEGGGGKDTYGYFSLHDNMLVQFIKKDSKVYPRIMLFSSSDDIVIYAYKAFEFLILPAALPLCS